MDRPNYYLESLLRGLKDGQKYDLDMCNSDIRNFYIEQKHCVDLVFENQIDFLFHIVCEYFAVNRYDAKKNDKTKGTRKRKLVYARAMFSKLVVKDYKAMNLKETGQYLQGRDHSTVINAIDVFNDLFDTDPNIKKGYYSIREQFDKYVKGNDKPTDTNK